MNNLAAKLKPLGWNERVLAWEDFERVAKVERVFIINVDSPDMEWKGFYALRGAQPVIALNASLRGIERLKVAWHEMAHHWLHTPALCFYTSDRYHSMLDKSEAEAHMIALVALIPEPLLRTMLTWEIEEAYGYHASIIKARLKILEEYGI